MKLASLTRRFRRAGAVVALGTALALPAAVPAAQSVDQLLHALESGSVEQRRQALQGLADLGDAKTVPAVVHALRDPDQVAREMAEQALWAIWMHSGDDNVDELLRKGSYLLTRERPEEAVPYFDQVIQRLPDFAEGYNKRATAWYELGEYEKSLADIDETLKRNPYHFGALSGGGLCMIELGRYEEAVRFFDRALAINPNLEGISRLRHNIQARLRRPLI